MDKKIIGKNISILYRHENMFADSEFKKYNLNKVQAEILLFLNSNIGANLTVINNYFLFNKATITKIIKHLEEYKYIQRVINEDDKRERDIFLTEKGQQLLPKLVEVFKEWESHLKKNISEVDIKCIRNVLSEMVVNITKKGSI